MGKDKKVVVLNSLNRNRTKTLLQNSYSVQIDIFFVTNIIGASLSL